MNDAPTDDGQEPDNGPTIIEFFREMKLNEEQPLLGIGWRCDYDRKGVTRPDRFIPLTDLEAMRDGLQGCKARGEDVPVYLDTVTGTSCFSLEDLESVVDAFEHHEENREERDGERDGEAWARDASTPMGAARELASAYWDWMHQTEGSNIRLDVAFDLLPHNVKEKSWAYRRGFTEAIARFHPRTSNPVGTGGKE